MPRNQFNLTEREKEILQLIYEGYTDNEIAKALDISKNTVRTHRENLRAKFKVNNTPSMIKIAVEMKLV